MRETRISDGTLLLRLPGAQDVEAMVAACQDPEIPRWTSVPAPYTRADAEAWVTEAARAASAGSALHLLVLTAGGGRLLGSAGLVELDLAAGWGEIGYWLAAEARGGGVMTRAVRLLRDHGAGALGLRTLEILSHRDNAPSRRVAERAGFVDTGERRLAPRSAAGGAADHVVYAWSSSR